MLSLILGVAALVIYVKLWMLAFKLSWGFIKVLFTIILSPLIFIALLVTGITYGALIILIVMGIIAVITPLTAG